MDESERELLFRSRQERRAIVAKYDKGREPGAEIDDWEDPKNELFHAQDRYGFIHDQRLPEVTKRSERERKQIEVEVSRSKKWAEMMDLNDPKKLRKYFEPQAKYREKMINRIYKGVPDSVRGRLWYILLDIKELKETQEGVYERMKEVARRHSPDIRQIDLDVNRTYRDHIMFRERYNPRQNALFHVLAAYSVYNTELGYCQGMSQIAALLLMYLYDEEDAFWALHRLMVHPKHAMHGFFIQGFPKLLRFQSHHDKVMRKFLPKLKKHLDRQGIDTGIYTLKWFFQCFLDRIPFSLTLRVWDLYILEGERVMIAMAYSILWIHRRKLMKMQMDEAIEHLQINLAVDFGMDDDLAIERLRENMHDMRSHRLDHPGRAPSEELPEKPFGLVDYVDDHEHDPDMILPDESKPKEWTVAKEAGLRIGFTEKEREFSHNAILRASHMENADLDEMDDEEDFDDTGLANSFDDSSQMRALRSTSTAAGQDFDTSFDASDIIPNNGGNGGGHEVFDDDDDVVHVLQGGKSPLPPSQEQDRLDNSLRELLKAASELSNTSIEKRPRSHLLEANCEKSSNSKLETSFESYFGVERSASNSDVVRIKVPYSRDDALRMKKATSVQDDNKIRIAVNNGKLNSSSNQSNENSSNHYIKSNSKSMTNL